MLYNKKLTVATIATRLRSMSVETNLAAPIVAWVHDGFWHGSAPRNTREADSRLFIAKMTQDMVLRQVSRICLDVGLQEAHYDQREHTPGRAWRAVRVNSLSPSEGALREAESRIRSIGFTAASYFNMHKDGPQSGSIDTTLFDIANHERAKYPGLMLGYGFVLCPTEDLPTYDNGGPLPGPRDPSPQRTPAIDVAMAFLSEA